MNNQNISHIVIVGGGFGGLSAAKALANKNVKVTLVDKRNYHLFQPLLYQVAMAGLSPAEIAYPLRAALSGQDNIEILLGEVQEVNKEDKYIKTEANKISYDFLILACGSTYTYFNSPQWEPYAPSLKTIAQATEIRKRVFLAFEKAEREVDGEKKKSLLTFVVVGGGPTGVELAGSLGEITRYSLKKDFKNIKTSQARIILIEAGSRILASMPESLSSTATKQLEELGVQVWVNSKVTNIDESGIKVGNEYIESCTIVWAAGVAANPINKTLNVELDRQGRIIVNEKLNIPNYSDIFVIGDQANFKDAQGNPLPGLAPVAMQQGRYVVKEIKNRLEGHQTNKSFVYTDKGQMATIGRSRAVGVFKNIQFDGFLAWAAWLAVHLYYIIGFKNRSFVLFQWAFTYLTYRRGARLIIDNK